MSTEKLQILNMVKDGKISAEEGVKLLEALEDTPNTTKALSYSGSNANLLKIKVFDPDDNTKVNVTLPIA